MKKLTFLVNLIQAKIFCLLMFMILTGCKSIDVRGQFVSDDAIKEINERKLTQEEIINLIGTPTYQPEYSNNTWYYIQRSLSTRAWFNPKLLEQRIVKIVFNEHGKAMEAKLIDAMPNDNIIAEKKYTKTYGTEQTSIQKFVKNIGRFNKTTDGKKKKQKKST